MTVLKLTVHLTVLEGPHTLAASLMLRPKNSILSKSSLHYVPQLPFNVVGAERDQSTP